MKSLAMLIRVYGEKQAVAINQLLQKVDPTFAADVDCFVYNTIWAQQDLNPLMEKALVAIIALFSQNHITPLKTLLQAYLNQLSLDDDKKITQELGQLKLALQMVYTDSCYNQALESIREATKQQFTDNQEKCEILLASIDQHPSVNLTERQTALALLTQHTAQKNSEALKQVIQSIINKKSLSMADMGAAILQTLPYCGLRCCEPAFAILISLIEDSDTTELLTAQKREILSQIKQKKDQDSTLANSDRTWIAKTVLQTSTNFTLSPQPPTEAETKLIAFTRFAMNGQIQESDQIDLSVEKKRAILNYLWIYAGCPHTWDGHAHINQITSQPAQTLNGSYNGINPKAKL